MRLITNLSSVRMDVNGRPLNLACHAMVLEQSIPIFGNEGAHRIRGFGPDSAWSVFTLWLSCNNLDYETRDAASNNVVMITDSHPEGRPLLSGAVMTFKDGTELFLVAQDADQPIDITDHDDNDYLPMWDVLNEKTRHYYIAPGFPVLNWTLKSLV